MKKLENGKLGILPEMLLSRLIPVDQLVDSEFNTTTYTGDLSDLCMSLRTKGMLQPIIVRPKNGKYEVVAGKKRSRAAKWSGFKKVPAVVFEKLSDVDAVVLSLTENVHRRTATEEDQIKWVGWLYERLKSVRKVADKMNMGKNWVNRLLTAGHFLDEVGEKIGVPNGDTPLEAQETAKTGKTENEFSISQLALHEERIPSTRKVAEIASIAKHVWPNSVEKQRELYEAVKDLPYTKMRRVLNQARQTPDVSVEDIKEEAFKEPTLITLNITFPAASSDGLRKASDHLEKPYESIVAMAVNEWLKERGFIGRGGRLSNSRTPPRSENRIIADILRVCRGGTRMNNILERANLCHADAQRYTTRLKRHGMLDVELVPKRPKSKKVVKVFSTTMKGHEWLNKFVELDLEGKADYAGIVGEVM